MVHGDYYITSSLFIMKFQSKVMTLTTLNILIGQLSRYMMKSFVYLLLSGQLNGHMVKLICIFYKDTIPIM